MPRHQMLDPPRKIPNPRDKTWTRLVNAPPTPPTKPDHRAHGGASWTQRTAATTSDETRRATIAYIDELAQHDEGEDLHPARLDRAADELARAMGRERA